MAIRFGVGRNAVRRDSFQNHAHLGFKRLRDAVTSAGSADCRQLHAAIQKAILDFTAGAEQADDLTLVVVEYRGGR